MVILGCMLLGAIAGGVETRVFQSGHKGVSASVAVGTLGAMLGLATDRWIGLDGVTSLPYCEYFAAGIGAVLLLGLWNIAQRLFLSTPTATEHE